MLIESFERVNGGFVQAPLFLSLGRVSPAPTERTNSKSLGMCT